MAKIEFPKWKYHGKKEAVIVQTAEQEKLLGPDWKDSPADVVVAQKPDKTVKK